ncbi:MAG: hypothetical protein ABEJ85_03355, partial [Haloarculaceae archaeon]
MQPLFFLTESPLVAVTAALTALIVFGAFVASGYWARREAAAEDRSLLDVLVYMWTGIGALHYFHVRYVRGEPRPGGAENRGHRPGRRERVAAAHTVAVVVAFLAGAVLTPPDPLSQVRTFPPLFAVGFAGAYALTRRRAA